MSLQTTHRYVVAIYYMIGKAVIFQYLFLSTWILYILYFTFLADFCTIIISRRYFFLSFSIMNVSFEECQLSYNIILLQYM